MIATIFTIDGKNSTTVNFIVLSSSAWEGRFVILSCVSTTITIRKYTHTHARTYTHAHTRTHTLIHTLRHAHTRIHANTHTLLQCFYDNGIKVRHSTIAVIFVCIYRPPGSTHILCVVSPDFISYTYPRATLVYNTISLKTKLYIIVLLT